MAAVPKDIETSPINCALLCQNISILNQLNSVPVPIWPWPFPPGHLMQMYMELQSKANQARTITVIRKPYKCDQCPKSYSSSAALHMHSRTHSQGCVCPYCSKTFSRHWLLQGHIRTHTGEKPFKCELCNKCFADKSNMRAHVQTHSGEKPWICTRCGKAFALKSYLSKHQESACVRTLLPKFSLDI